MDEKQQISEVEVADHLEKFRAKQAGFLDTSFETISGVTSTYIILTEIFVVLAILLILTIPSWLNVCSLFETGRNLLLYHFLSSISSNRKYKCLRRIILLFQDLDQTVLLYITERKQRRVDTWMINSCTC